MWYVDLAWPLGLDLIGIYNLVFVATTLKGYMVCGAVLFQGLRMTLGATKKIVTGEWHPGMELQRYEYQRIMLEQKKGEGAFNMAYIHFEIYFQAIANYTLLIVPITLVANDKSEGFTALEIIGFAIWVFSYVFEHTGDIQKKKFIA